MSWGIILWVIGCLAVASVWWFLRRMFRADYVSCRDSGFRASDGLTIVCYYTSELMFWGLLFLGLGGILLHWVES